MKKKEKIKNENADFSKARILFLRYEGNHFDLTRESDYDDYNVPKELELEWQKELDAD